MHPTFTNLFLLYSFPMHSFLSRVLCNILINFNFRRCGKKFNKFSDSNGVFDEIYLNSLWYWIKIPRQHRIFNFAKCHWFSLNGYIQNCPKRLSQCVCKFDGTHSLFEVNLVFDKHKLLQWLQHNGTTRMLQTKSQKVLHPIFVLQSIQFSAWGDVCTMYNIVTLWWSVLLLRSLTFTTNRFWGGY